MTDEDEERTWMTATRGTMWTIRQVMGMIEETQTDPESPGGARTPHRCAAQRRWLLLREALTSAAQNSDDEVRAYLNAPNLPWRV